MQANYAGAGRRLVAALLDSVILFAINISIAMLLVGSFSLMPTEGAENAAGGILILISYIILPVGYWVVLQSQMGQTLGKKALGIKVVDSEGKTPSVVTFFLREIVGKIVSAIILLIGYLMILWDSKKQGLHDKIAGTYVIRV